MSSSWSPSDADCDTATAIVEAPFIPASPALPPPPPAPPRVPFRQRARRLLSLANRLVGSGSPRPVQGQADAKPMSQRIAPENLVVILRISSHHVSSTVAALHATHGDKVVAHKVIDCVWADLTQAARRQAVAEAIHLATDSAGVEPWSVFLSLSDPSISSRLAMGWADPGDEVVLTEHEQLWALKRARDQATGGDDELVDAIPVQWTVRDQSGEREVANPVGERGSRLTCQALLVTARAGYRAEMEKLVEGLGVEIEGIIAQPVALYRGIGSSLSKKGSTLVIDCGARCTTLIVRRRDRLIHLQTHPFGGDDLTRALAERLRVTPAQAEEMKHDLDISLQADPGFHHEGQQFIWSEMRERHRLARPAAALVGDLVEEFFRARAQELRDAGLLGQQGQVHLFGRASGLGGLASRLKSVLDLPVHLGTGSKNRDPSAEMSDAIISGLVCAAADHRRQHIAANPRPIRATASGAWAWLTKPIE